MRIIVLNGSPRPSGNTKTMISAFTEGAERAGHGMGIDTSKDPLDELREFEN